MIDLEEKLKNIDYDKALIITEGVFSMDGDIAQIDRIVKLKNKYKVDLMVDDAHGIGVLGKRGVIDFFDLNYEIDIYLGTLSKAIGTEGGFVSGSQELIEFLRNKSRAFIYSTAISQSLCAGTITALELIENESLVEALNKNIKYFNKKLKEELHIENKNETAIIPILIWEEKKAVEIAEQLFKKGIYISAIRYPTVKRNKAILRICLMKNHTKDDIDRVFNELVKLL